MAQTVVLAPITAASSAVEFTITGAPATVSVFGLSGADIVRGFSLSIHRKIGSDVSPRPTVMFHQNFREASLSPGKFQILKPATIDAIGVVVED